MQKKKAISCRKEQEGVCSQAVRLCPSACDLECDGGRFSMWQKVEIRLQEDGRASSILSSAGKDDVLDFLLSLPSLCSWAVGR